MSFVFFDCSGAAWIACGAEDKRARKLGPYGLARQLEHHDLVRLRLVDGSGRTPCAVAESQDRLHIDAGDGYRRLREHT